MGGQRETWLWFYFGGGKHIWASVLGEFSVFQKHLWWANECGSFLEKKKKKELLRVHALQMNGSMNKYGDHEGCKYPKIGLANKESILWGFPQFMEKIEL